MPLVEIPAGQSRSRRLWVGLACLAAVTTGLLGFLVYRARAKPLLTASDSVLVADFQNTTGDAVFDGTLKQAVIIGLSQSPYLNVISEDKAVTTLKLMTPPANTPLTPQ